MRFWQRFKSSMLGRPVSVGKAMPLQQSNLERACAFLRLDEAPVELTQMENAPLIELMRAGIQLPVYQVSERAQKNALQWPLSQVFVSRKHKLLYCPIGKSACTFLKQQMARLSGHFEVDVILQDIHLLTDHVNTGLQLGDLPAEEAKMLIDAPDAFRFAVFRDPMERLLSAYMEKFVFNRNTPENIIHTETLIPWVQAAQSEGLPDYDLGLSFREFIEAITSLTPLELDTHWRPQATYLDGMQYDRIYRFSEIEVLLQDLERRTGTRLDRQPQNVTGSGHGRFVERACDLKPKELEAIAHISHESFWAADLRAKVYRAVQNQATVAPVFHRCGRRKSRPLFVLTV